MRKHLLLVCLCAGVLSGKAQVEEKYGLGKVPVVNGRVMFQDTIIVALDDNLIYEKMSVWAKKRFNKPNVIVSRFVSEDVVNYQLGVTAEEWIDFKKKFFVWDRTRINYWVEFQCHNHLCVVRLTRINYWYEEERDGGLKFSAEEWITDANAFNSHQTKLLKEPGKFRKKTIDFFEQIVQQLSQTLQ